MPSERLNLLECAMWVSFFLKLGLKPKIVPNFQEYHDFASITIELSYSVRLFYPCFNENCDNRHKPTGIASSASGLLGFADSGLQKK